MRIGSFLKEKAIMILFHTLVWGFCFLFLSLIGVSSSILILFLVLFLFLFITIILSNYFHERKIYHKKKYLLETVKQFSLLPSLLPRPKHMMRRIDYDLLKKATDWMQEELEKQKDQQRFYQEYIEEWIHEMKTPLSGMHLLCENHKGDPILLEKIIEMEDLIEQTLYYAKSETMEKDYVIREVNLSELVHQVILKEKTLLLEHHIMVSFQPNERMVYTDYKWFFFILDQIFQNSIKYKGENPQIKITITDQNKDTLLTVEDNGCGISASDLPRVFEKGFTGTNRKKKYATGMGLYLAYQLCQKLGIDLSITSEEGDYTNVQFVFKKGELHSLDIENQSVEQFLTKL